MFVTVDSFGYNFPAIRGVQAGREYYISQCPLHVIPKIFQFDDVDLPPEVRSQRILNKGRLPEIVNYILTNRDEYVFSAITASIDGDVSFVPIEDPSAGNRLGLLQVPMTARFLINDGQHRRAAIEQALQQDPSLRDETIAVVFFVDRGLERAQQMFADLNRYAVRPSTSLGVLYDHRDPMAAVVRQVVQESALLRFVVEPEKTTLAPRSRKLFTLSAIFTASRSLLIGIGEELSSTDQVRVVGDFWSQVAPAFPEWDLVRANRLTAAEVRQDFIHSHGIVLHSLGRVGALLVTQPNLDWSRVVERLSAIDWSRANATLWEGRALVGGRVAKSTNNVILTTNVIKQHLDLPLSPEEVRLEEAVNVGRK
jgi:DNA sulfur modification protein DndB